MSQLRKLKRAQAAKTLPTKDALIKRVKRLRVRANNPKTTILLRSG